MRTLFIPLAKLLGIFLIFRALPGTLYIISDAIYRQKFAVSIILSCIIYGFSMLLALILIFKTDKIADIVKIPQEKIDSHVFDFHSILRVGLVLIGVAMLVYAVPSLIGWAVVVMADQARVIPPYRQLYTPILRIVFGSCLVLLANRLAQFLNKHKE